MKWYEVGIINLDILEVEVEKETDKCIYIRGYRRNKESKYRRNKESEYSSFFKTIEEAKLFRINNLKRMIEFDKGIIERRKRNIETLTEKLNLFIKENETN